MTLTVTFAVWNCHNSHTSWDSTNGCGDMFILSFVPNDIFLISEAMHFKFCVLFDAEEY